MLRLPDRALSAETAAHLQSQQAEIDKLPDHNQQAALAETFWSAKEAVKTGGKAAFEEVEAVLRELSPVADMCQYCEMGEGSDIEHVAPKMLFPGSAFQWLNYLLVCKQCNTGKKLDQMYVFVAGDRSQVVKVKRGQAPPSQDIAFFNPRVEDPMTALRLNLNNFLFEPDGPRETDTSGRSLEKAVRTIEILDLNGRRRLKADREDAFRDYVNQLKVYVEAARSRNFVELKQATSGIPPHADKNGDFELEKRRLITALRDGFSRTSHPTVLREMLRQSDQLSPELQANIQASGIRDWLPR